MGSLLLFRHFVRLPLIQLFRDTNIRRSKSSTRPVDPCGIPIEPTWSVNELLSSYPSPALSNQTIKKLYELSALVPLEEGTPRYESVKTSLEEMIRLVEAIRLVDTTGVSPQGRRVKEDADRERFALKPKENGEALLKHASCVSNGFYVVDSDRRR